MFSMGGDALVGQVSTGCPSTMGPGVGIARLDCHSFGRDCIGVSIRSALPYGKRLSITPATEPAMIACTWRPTNAMRVTGSISARSTP